MRCRNPDKRKDALDEVAMKIWKSRNRKIKVPNKFRPIKIKAPTDECKCLTVRLWSHLELNFRGWVVDNQQFIFEKLPWTLNGH